MKKSTEMEVVKTFAASTIIPVIVFTCVIAKVILSQATCRDFAVARALGHSEQNSGTEERTPEHSLATVLPGIEDDSYQQKKSPDASVTAETMEDQPELKLLLISIFPGNPLVARALIKDLKSNSVGVYKTGQQIGTGHIANIRRNEVVVVDHRRRFILKPAFSQSRSVSAPQDAAQAEFQTSRRIPIGTPPVAEACEDCRTPVASLKSLLIAAKLEPFSLNGRAQGLKVSALDNTLVANEMNIKQGDVIHRINGHILINKQQAWQVLKKAKSQDTIDVEVLYND